MLRFSAITCVYRDAEELNGDSGVGYLVANQEVVLLKRHDADHGGLVRGDGEWSVQRHLLPGVGGDAAVLAGAAAGYQADPGSLPVILLPAPGRPVRLAAAG